MKILAVIPARYHSQRFPGKVLAKIGEQTMVERVYRAACTCPDFNQVVVATEHEAVAACVQEFGGPVELTRADHATGTDRVAEVAERYPEMDVIVNVQGDQPFATGQILSQLVSPFVRGEQPPMATLACPLDPQSGYQDSHTVKVICDLNNNALYFSRSPIPFFRHQKPAPVYHHLGFYAFTREFLQTYSELTPTPLEQCEDLEQLRALEWGYKIQVSVIEQFLMEVNTLSDWEAANALIASQ
ncbi:MAG: 3-deoxy-manno-octulosonate cytidylyltransferase [Cyanobacteria bacterium P01_H01_bin.15]